MAGKEKKLVPEAKLYNKNYTMETGQYLGLYMVPNFDLIKFSPEDDCIRNIEEKSVRKIEVNGEESLINTRQDDPNP